jgi:hypothetical protein
MSEPRSDWDEAADDLGGLALKLRLHLEQQRAADDAAAGDEVVGLSRRVQGTVEALGRAATDEAVRHDARHAGQAVSRAASRTLLEVVDMVTRAYPVAGQTRAARPSGATDPTPEPTP